MDNIDIDVIVPWGDYKGMPIKEIPSGYLSWIRDDAECGDELKDASDIELNFRTKFKKHFYV